MEEWLECFNTNFLCAIGVLEVLWIGQCMLLFCLVKQLATLHKDLVPLGKTQIFGIVCSHFVESIYCSRNTRILFVFLFFFTFSSKSNSVAK